MEIPQGFRRLLGTSFGVFWEFRGSGCNSVKTPGSAQQFCVLMATVMLRGHRWPAPCQACGCSCNPVRILSNTQRCCRRSGRGRLGSPLIGSLRECKTTSVGRAEHMNVLTTAVGFHVSQPAPVSGNLWVWLQFCENVQQRTTMLQEKPTWPTWKPTDRDPAENTKQSARDSRWKIKSERRPHGM